MKNIKVAISTTTRKFDILYTYTVGLSLESKIKIGSRVIVPFGRSNKSVEGVVFEINNDIEDDNINLKEIISVVDETPFLSTEFIDLIKWMKVQYIITYYDAINIILPTGNQVKAEKFVELLNENNGNELKVIELRILQVLVENNRLIEYSQLKKAVKSSVFNQTIDSLCSKGIVKIYEKYTQRVKEKTINGVTLAKSREEILILLESNQIKNIGQIKVLEILIENEYISVADIQRFANVSRSVINTLIKNTLIEHITIEVQRDPLRHLSYEKTTPLVPTNEQKEVLDDIKKDIYNNEFSETLIFGVTGSGKTEIYLQLIQEVINKNKTAIVLVPEISLTPQTVKRFKGRFGDEVAVLHSRLSLGERFDQWMEIFKGRIKIVVGVRSAIFAPLKNIGIVIIDEEHEDSYRADSKPKYDARDIAKKRCQYYNGVLVYGSATPSIEMFYKANLNEIKLFELTKRANNSILPKVNIVDMREELKNGNRTMFSYNLQVDLENVKNKNEQSILFLNRRGYSSFVFCRDCGYTVMCEKCNVSLTYHKSNNRLICHYCGYTTTNPRICPKCEGKNIKNFGIGTQKVEEDLKKLIPEISVVRMDMDTTTYKNSHEDILKKFEDERINTLVGTQMIAKGHHFPLVTLVGVLSTDSMLNSGNYRSSEKAFSLLTQVAGRAGRGEKEGRVIVQAYNVDHYALIHAQNQDYRSFYKDEISIREKLLYPPFTNIGLILLSGTDNKFTCKVAKSIFKFLNEEFQGINGENHIYEPLAPQISKINEKFRWRIILKVQELNFLRKVMYEVNNRFYDNKLMKGVDLNIDINPKNII